MTARDARGLLQAYHNRISRLIYETKNSELRQRLIVGDREDRQSHHYRTLDRIAGMTDEHVVIDPIQTIEEIVREDGVQEELNRPAWNRSTLSGFLSLCCEELTMNPPTHAPPQYWISIKK